MQSLNAVGCSTLSLPVATTSCRVSPLQHSASGSDDSAHPKREDELRTIRSSLMAEPVLFSVDGEAQIVGVGFN